jgi:hypothetical protein
MPAIPYVGLIFGARIGDASDSGIQPFLKLLLLGEVLYWLSHVSLKSRCRLSNPSTGSVDSCTWQAEDKARDLPFNMSSFSGPACY